MGFRELNLRRHIALLANTLAAGLAHTCDDLWSHEETSRRYRRKYSQKKKKWLYVISGLRPRKAQHTRSYATCILAGSSRVWLTGRHGLQPVRSVALTQLMAFRAHFLGFFQVQGLLLGKGSSRSGFEGHAVSAGRAGELLPGFTVAVRGEAARVHLQTILAVKSCVYHQGGTGCCSYMLRDHMTWIEHRASKGLRDNFWS